MDGKVVLISGGARGQGRAHALTMAREGADVVVFDICRDIPHSTTPQATEEDLHETRRLVEALDRRCVALTADARSPREVREVVATAVDQLGGIDAVSINHGIGMYATLLDTTYDEWQTQMDVNCTAGFVIAKAVVPHMIERGKGGAIVITASTFGLIAFPNLSAYVAAKHGIVGLMKAMAIELAPHMIRCNAICPGTINTPMVHNPLQYELMSGGKKGATWEDLSPFVQAVQKLPVDQLDPEDISNALLYLCSDRGR
jgi:SDR family mycofactocin-dependent oxidoreductase